MATTNGVLPAGLEKLALKSDTSKPGDELDQSAFLKLMLTQIQHQDPLNPMSSNEFFGQLAQISTVNGIAGLQSSFDQFAASLQSGLALQATTMVGRTVLVEGSTVELNDAGSIRGAVDLAASTAELLVTISDASGQVVKQLNLGSQTAGTVNVVWDGKDSAGGAVAPGRYQITAQASIDGEVTALPTLVQAKVESVTLTKNGEGPLLLNLQGLGSFPMHGVRKVL